MAGNANDETSTVEDDLRLLSPLWPYPFLLCSENALCRYYSSKRKDMLLIMRSHLSSANLNCFAQRSPLSLFRMAPNPTFRCLRPRSYCGLEVMFIFHWYIHSFYAPVYVWLYVCIKKDKVDLMFDCIVAACWCSYRNQVYGNTGFEIGLVKLEPWMRYSV